MPRANKDGQVAVAMSGGVDSSVAAALLVSRGYMAVGLTMKLFCYEKADRGRSCCSLESIELARRAAQQMGIPHYVVDCSREFQRHVVDPFVLEYQRGRTPNPCVACNQMVKFGALLRKAQQLGCGRLATGHYARIRTVRGRLLLAKGRDPQKDQSYFLWPLSQEQLAAALFPLGAMTKQQVRALAARLGLPSAKRPESQEICFVQQGSYADFVRGRAAPMPGDIVDLDGKVLGRHRGIANYTIGQREGLGIALGKRAYVVAIDARRGRIVVGDDGHLWTDRMAAGQVSWSIAEPSRPVKARVKIRHQHQAAEAMVAPQSGGRAEIIFSHKQRAITPGQSTVFYRGNAVIGGGIIEGR